MTICEGENQRGRRIVVRWPICTDLDQVGCRRIHRARDGQFVKVRERGSMTLQIGPFPVGIDVGWVELPPGGPNRVDPGISEAIREGGVQRGGGGAPRCKVAEVEIPPGDVIHVVCGTDKGGRLVCNDSSRGET